ncbi:MAG TPA: hypothetical protein V6D29_16310 [Leptolyngbyaceae cyanobacterium]
MIPNLLEATHEYMQKLNELEAAYQRDEVSIEEVDAQVKVLMADLGRTRKEALSAFMASLRYTLQNQWETIAGVAGVGVLALWWATTLSGGVA